MEQVERAGIELAVGTHGEEKHVGQALRFGVQAEAIHPLLEAQQVHVARRQRAGVDRVPQRQVDLAVGIEMVGVWRQPQLGDRGVEGRRFGAVGIEQCEVEVEQHGRVGHVRLGLIGHRGDIRR